MAPAVKRRKRSISKATSKKKTKRRTGEVVCESDDGSAIRQIVVLKKRYDVKRYEESEECFILDFDPYEAGEMFSGTIDEDVVVVSEKGQVACRDYPHPRHLCVKFPFDNSMHESYCKLCYCYVCDTAAPCKYWMYSRPGPGHCHASDSVIEWKLKRESLKIC